ncbi:cellulose biosynthesis cyclic di-GMP-binding regulatory protein BcsB [Chloroflexi bacterium TSY]|nr:cellulose biosynthesis cyclic di-GMP-binding regulatory protein BcsB [Chloroflexi bacterium TSY]
MTPKSLQSRLKIAKNAKFGSTETFSGLGYDLETIEGTGRRTLQFKFTVSPDQILHDDGVVDFKFAHSNLVDYARSGVVVLLNDKPVGSIRLGETTADLTSSVIRLPKNLVKSGLNRLTVQADLRSALTCSGLDGSGAWLTVYPSSALNLPLSPSTEASPHVQNLSDYPNLITLGNTLNNLAFVLPKSAPMAWNLASRFAFDLGRRADIDLADLAVVFDSALDESVKRERDLIVIGTPTRLPLLAEFNASLPVPFEAGSNRLVAVELSAAYRLPLETKMGYLQLLRAPWNQARTIVNVLGSSPEGMALAAVALLDGQRRSMLAGNFALVDEMQVSVRQLMPASAGLNISDIPLNESGESLLASQPGLNDLELAFQANPIVYEQPAWILPTLLASLIIAFAIGLWVTLSSIWARRPKSA